jgi:hypothetical protein
MITAEIQANNIKVQELAGEEGAKVAQNVAAGVADVVIPVLWFGMDFKGAASKEVLRSKHVNSTSPYWPPSGVSPPAMLHSDSVRRGTKCAVHTALGGMKPPSTH